MTIKKIPVHMSETSPLLLEFSEFCKCLVAILLPFQQNFQTVIHFSLTKNPRPGHVRCKSSSLASTVPVALLHFKGLRSRAIGLHVQGGKTRLQMQPRRLQLSTACLCIEPNKIKPCLYIRGTLCRVCPFFISQRNKLLREGCFFNTAQALESLPQKHGASKVVVAPGSQGQRGVQYH